jgi:Asp/Glu/hydantoin racemase
VSLWSTWFGKKLLAGVKIINVGNEAVQLNFMDAHQKGEPCPPQINIDLFCNYAKDLYDLYKVDAILISCSTMNRAFNQVSEFMKPYNVPVIQIDEAMMEEAVNSEGRILVVATHGPTVKSTQELLMETAEKLGKKVDFAGVTVEEAFDLLGEGKIDEHNEVIAKAIREVQSETNIDIVVLAQLSMSVFSFSYPDPEKEFGVKVLNSGETGFARAGEVLKKL